MASIPIRLGIGMVSIYGAGASTQNISPGVSSPLIQFGVVDGMNNQYGAVSVGQSVMYDIKDIVPPILFDNQVFFIIPEDKLIAVEDTVIPPP